MVSFPHRFIEGSPSMLTFYEPATGTGGQYRQFRADIPPSYRARRAHIYISRSAAIHRKLKKQFISFETGAVVGLFPASR